MSAIPAELVPAHLSAVPPAADDTHALQRRLNTEQSANAALLSAMGDLQRQLDAERASVKQLNADLARERADTTYHLNQSSQLWGEVALLKAELEMATAKPFVARLLGR